MSQQVALGCACSVVTLALVVNIAVFGLGDFVVVRPPADASELS